ncbi:MAG TPA: EAL domain-containing protein [Candidatus Sulfotelmatobacter sp.]|nr:EAL domain-containing protein [Candidatus Sulfotelmatobacter sp.]
MTSPVRILVADDNALDAELALRELRRSGMEVEGLVAPDEAAFRRGLTGFAPDVILCDFSFPGFSGLAALHIAREVVPRTPLIFVSGTISEEKAVRAVREGAVDYVLKHNLFRLPDAVTRAIDEARERARREVAEAQLAAERERMSALLENVDSALRSYSLLEERYHYLNAATARVYGRPLEDFWHGEEIWREIVHADDWERFAVAREELMRLGAAAVEYRAVHPDGAVRWVDQRSKVARDESGRAIRVDTIAADVTERVQAAQHLLRVSRVRDLQAAVNSAIVRTAEPASLCREACRIASDVGGFPLAAVITVGDAEAGPTLEASSGGYEYDRVLFRVREALADPKGARSVIAASLRAGAAAVANDLTDPNTINAEAPALLASGVRAFGSFPFRIDASRSGLLILGAAERDFFNTEEVELVTGLANNLGFALELAAKRGHLDYLANYDPVTDLPNRALALRLLEREIVAARRAGDRLGVLVFDLYQFANVNTTLGDTAGDTLLRDVAQRLRERVGPTRAARLAGDRFVVIYPGPQAVEDVANALSPQGVELFAEPFLVGGRDLRVTARAGCSVYPEDGAEAEELVQHAEAALQSARAAEVAHRFYAPELDARLRYRFDLEARLRRAVDANEFELHYQPKVRLADRGVTGVEALLRWRDPQREGLVSPAEFIPILEETGLIVEVGRWAIAEAARQHAAWSRAGLRAPRVAVNVSVEQIRAGTVLDDVRCAIAKSGSAGIDLEVTESGVMGNIGEAIAVLGAIRELGVGIAIDDFGTGYSSLAYVFRLPITSFKIDRSFVSGMTADANMVSIVSTMISLGRDLGLGVVAEGVETEEEAKLLRLLRCEEMQGFLAARPMPAEALERWLTSWP